MLVSLPPARTQCSALYGGPPRFMGEYRATLTRLASLDEIGKWHRRGRFDVADSNTSSAEEDAKTWYFETGCVLPSAPTRSMVSMRCQLETSPAQSTIVDRPWLTPAGNAPFAVGGVFPTMQVRQVGC